MAWSEKGQLLNDFVDKTSNQNVNGIKTFLQDLIVNGLTVGRGPGASNTNTVFGIGALAARTTGLRNVAIGLNSQATVTTGTNNTTLGHNAGSNLPSGTQNNILLGQGAGQNSVGGNVICIGNNAGATATTDSTNSVIIGSNARNSAATQATNIIAIGANTLNNADGNIAGNVAIGTSALNALSNAGATAQYNVAIGSNAGQSRISGSNAVLIGLNAGLSNNAVGVVAIGAGALSGSSTATPSGVVCIGNNAGAGTTFNSAGGVCIGARSGFNAFQPVIAIGENACEDTAGANVSGSIAIGRNAFRNVAHTAQFNTLIGNLAGRDLGSTNTSFRNTFIGAETGLTATTANASTTGSDNTFVGYRTGLSSPTQLNFATAIGSGALVGTSNTVVLGRTSDATIIGATDNDGSGAKLQVTGHIKTTTQLNVGSNKVVGARETGWVTPTGTATKGTGATYTAPSISNPPTQAEVQAMADALQLATRHIKALTDMCITHGLIGS